MALRGLFVTGTDTGVGKTFVTAAIAKHLPLRSYRVGGRNQPPPTKVGAYKPVVSGAEMTAAGPVWSDVETLWHAIGPYPRERIAPQRFLAPLAPPVAAHHEGRQVDEKLLRRGIDWWLDRVDVLLVEGAGGLLSPVSDNESNAELARDLGFPLLVVARAGLGTINHTLLTLEAAERRNLPVAGVILNQTRPDDGADLSVVSNAAELRARTSVPILGVFPFSTPEGLLEHPEFNKIHWQDLIGLSAHSFAGDSCNGEPDTS